MLKGRASLFPRPQNSRIARLTLLLVATLALILTTRHDVAAMLSRPVLDNSGAPTLPPLDEDSSGGDGISLVDLIGDTITNTANGAEVGLAVTGLTGSGAWQYSLDDGNTWTDLGPVSDTNATVLPLLYPRYPLYQGTTGGNPFSQGWLVTRNDFSAFVGPSGITETVGSAATTFDSTGSYDIMDGYGSHVPDYFNTNGGNPLKWNSAYPTLDPTAGYTIRLEMQINTEDHNAGTADKDGDGTDDRAGVSLISVSSDTSKAIELAFWEDEIWAQEDGDQDPPGGSLFTHAEGISYTTTPNTIYDVTIQGNTYQLSANGTSILTGPLRDYTAWNSSGVPLDGYETANFLFLGDDTTSARGKFTFSRLEILEETRLRFVPDQDFYGQATLTYRAANPDNQVTTGQNATGNDFSTNSETASITINPLPDPPTISDIADQTIEANTSLGPLTVTLSDPDVPASSLSLTATSSNQSLVPDANLTLGGSGATRTLTVTPTTGQTGATTITLTVDDGSLTDSDSFILTVEAAMATNPNSFIYLPVIIRE